MAHSWLKITLLLAASCSSLAEYAGFKRALEVSQSLEPRVLRAAALESDISKRGFGVPMRKSVMLHYVDEPHSREASSMAAHVSLKSERPSLVLEEMDHLVEEVHCDDGRMHVKFSPGVFPEVRREIEAHPEFLVITSHETCNEQGSRLAHLVTGCDLSESSSSVAFDTKPVSWRSAYHVKVDYGADEQKYWLNRHNHLRRRSLLSSFVPAEGSTTLAPTISTPAVSSVTTLSSTSTVAFPFPTSTAGVNETIVSTNISKAFINQQILPLPDNAALQGLSIGGVSAPSSGIGLTCLNCSIGGDIVMTSGSFSSSSNSSNKFLNSIESAVDFIEDGFIALTANNMFAHIELSATWSNDQSVGVSYPIALGTIPLQPFSIPDIAVIGPMFVPRLIVSAGVSASLNFTYGFEVVVPNNSTAFASIAQVNASTVTGFDQTTFKALPFNGSINDIALNLSATLQPEVLVGVSFLDSAESAGVGVFLNLPTLSLAVEAVTETDANCNPTSNSTLINEIQSRFGNLTHIVPAVELAAGFIAQAQAVIPGLPGINDQRAFTPLATTFAVPTTCLAFEKSSSGYATATAALASATATVATASSSSIASASNGVPSLTAATIQFALVGIALLLGPLMLW